VFNMSPDAIRTLRDMKLEASDWTHILSDMPIENKSAWATYRKSLRDISLHPKFSDDTFDNVDFPAAPDENSPAERQYNYVENPAEGESVWQQNPDWVDPATLPQPDVLDPDPASLDCYVG